MALSSEQLDQLVDSWAASENRTVIKSKDTPVRENAKTFILRDVTAH